MLDPSHAHGNTRTSRDQGEHPVVSNPLNHDKRSFMLNYFIAARRGGRTADCGCSQSRFEISQAASDLFDRADRISRGL